MKPSNLFSFFGLFGTALFNFDASGREYHPSPRQTGLPGVGFGPRRKSLTRRNVWKKAFGGLAVPSIENSRFE